MPDLTVYSYDASEDNEISFKEGERIIQIEAPSEDWWQGTNQHGHVGLFPGACLSFRVAGGDSQVFRVKANYVELQS